VPRRQRKRSSVIPLRRSERQRRRRISSNQTSPNHVAAPVSSSIRGTSIRGTARIGTISTGARANSSFSSSYHRQHRQHQCSGNNTRTNLQNEIEAASVMTNPRICICDNPSIPPSCTNGCSVEQNTRCQEHTLVSCTSNDCRRHFHLGCLASLRQVPINNFDPSSYSCMFCEESSVPASVHWTDLRSLETKLARYGIEYSHDHNIQHSRRREILKMQEVLKSKCDISRDILDAFQNNDPRPYPTAMAMSQVSKSRHVLSGRRFEISMLMYDVKQCSCCGRTQPGHVDPYFPKDVPFDWKHLMNKTHSAWHCTCDGFCKGSQFYGAKKRTEINLFQTKHGGETPWDFLGVDKNEPNAILCDACYYEIESKDVQGKIYNST